MTATTTSALGAFLGNGSRLRQVQESLLAGILGKNRDCGYGRRHGFARVGNAADYARLPLMRYDAVDGFDDYWDDPANFTGERLVAWFLTSGSSASPKRIPVTTGLVREKSRAFATFWDSVYTSHPVLRHGRFIANFADSGHSRRDADNRLETSETAFWNQRMQGFQDPGRWPLGKQLPSIRDAELRYYGAARLALQGALHCMMSLNPSTLVRFCQTIDEHAKALQSGLASGRWGIDALDTDDSLPDSLVGRLERNDEAAKSLRAATSGGPVQLRDLWPDFELLICWQSELVGPYLELLGRHTSGVASRDYITQSSECMMAVPIEDGSSGGLLAYESHFFEFAPEAEADSDLPPTLNAWELETGGRYEVVVTTSGGLYRYRMGDCVRVEDVQHGIPVLNFQYRLGRTSSITGEKLTEDQVLEALRRSGAGDVVDLSGVLVFPRTGEQPHYAVMLPEGAVRGDTGREQLRRWAGRLDVALGEANGEYRDKRDSLRLGDPEVMVVGDHALSALHRSLRPEHVTEEQYKPGVLQRERDLDRRLDVPGDDDANR